MDGLYVIFGAQFIIAIHCHLQLHKMKSSRDWTQTGWIAARFNAALPSEMRVGDNTKPGTGEYLNRALSPDLTYRIFIRAVSIGNVRVLYLRYELKFILNKF